MFTRGLLPRPLSVRDREGYEDREREKETKTEREPIQELSKYASHVFISKTKVEGHTHIHIHTRARVAKLAGRLTCVPHTFSEMYSAVRLRGADQKIYRQCQCEREIRSLPELRRLA